MRRSTSLIRQLTLLYSAVAAASFAAAGLYMHQSFASELERQDDIELIGKVELVRHMLSEVGSLDALRRDTHLFIDAMVGHRGLHLVIRSADHEPVLANIHPLAGLTVVPIDAEQAPTVSDIRNWTTSGGMPARAISAQGRIGGGKGGDEVGILIARDRSESTAILRAYRNRILAAGAGGALLAGGLGFLVVSAGLRPLADLAAKAARISIAHLDQRSQLAGGPLELQALVVSFNRMLDRVEDGVSRLSRFSSDLAHELRTPLTVLLGETQVALTRQRSPGEYQALLASNVEELERLTRMVNDMLFLATAEDAKVALHPCHLNFGEELRKIAEFLEDLGREHQVAIVVRVAASGVADVALFQRAVTNLVVNAIQYAPSHATVTLSAASQTKSVDVLVHNPGPAIAPELHERIFDRFFHGEQTRIGGSSCGLGLTIVQSIMRLHGGDVSVTSDSERGTTFRLEFPKRRPPA